MRFLSLSHTPISPCVYAQERPNEDIERRQPYATQRDRSYQVSTLPNALTLLSSPNQEKINTYYSRHWSMTSPAKTREPSSHQLFQASKATHPHFQGQTGLGIHHSHMKICAQWRRSIETARHNRSEIGSGNGKVEKVLSKFPGLRAAVKTGIMTGWDLAKCAGDSSDAVPQWSSTMEIT